ncbi:glycoside hydrolase domain-containing protein [Alistipes sp.]|uniref:glycoside hydrolase domain-containing protein n=1 Tax=Alistipes sp. TaxID=1872444 RepID=UPI0025BE4FC7|nr:glycoside hydrolase domain-containing protein [Alistipes sp.]
MIRTLCVAFLLLPIVGRGGELVIRGVDPLVNVLPGGVCPPEMDDTVRVARGENAVLQFVISSEDSVSEMIPVLQSLKTEQGASLDKKVFGWVRNVQASHKYEPAAPDALQSSSGEYPDPILTDSSISIAAGGTVVLWLDIPIPTDAKAGLYKGTIRISGLKNGTRIVAYRQFSIQVYSITLPEQSLLVTNWYFPDKFPFMNGGDPVEAYSPAYWACMRQLVETASAYGQNVWLLYETGVPVPTADGKGMSFDFSRIDKMIEFLLRHADVRLIEANHFAKRSHNGWTDPFWAEIPVLNGNGNYVRKRLPHDDPQVKQYISTYFPALQEHLRSKKLDDGTGRTWLDIYTQHIGDEPLDANKASWEGLARQVKQTAPDIRIIEAYRSSAYDPALIDILVPQLDEFAWDVYRKMPAGHSCWFYTCMYPRGSFANRYVTLPLIKTRLLHWINYKYNSPGYLHWGFNAWGANGDPFGDVSAPANDWPGGDSHIVYPGYRKLYPSIRLAAMRDGIRDYDLLKMVESRDSIRAQSFVNAIIFDFDRYDTSVSRFRQIRREILEFLEEVH